MYLASVCVCAYLNICVYIFFIHLFNYLFIYKYKKIKISEKLVIPWTRQTITFCSLTTVSIRVGREDFWNLSFAGCDFLTTGRSV